MPRGQDPRVVLGAALVVVLGLGAVVLVRFARRRAGAAEPVQAGSDRDVAYQERLDDELLEVD